MENAQAAGRLVCVGLGMTLGAHLAPRARAHLCEADVVFVAASDPLVELWVQGLHPVVHSLQPHYAEGTSRRSTYRAMVEAILQPVRAGRRVCAAFYGHPGVFAQVPHEAIARARAEGLVASMEPAISAEDCLYADLGLDPGRHGCQHYEATQFLLYRRRIDPSACLVLWQIAHVGDVECTRFATGRLHREVLLQRLLEDYPAGHEAILYEAATVALDAPRIERIALSALPDARLHMHSTLVIPAARPMSPDPGYAALLAAADRRERTRAARRHLSVVTA